MSPHHSIGSEEYNMRKSSLVSMKVNDHTTGDQISSTYCATGNLESMSLGHVPETRKESRQLPKMIVLRILSFVHPDDQQVFLEACKVSRTWYRAASSYLYAQPRITLDNYEKFNAALCPQISHIGHNINQSPLAGLIKSLDLTYIRDDERGSFTAQLLQRAAPNLETFIAPAAHFGPTCIVALGKCHKLRILDLRLVRQFVNMIDLFNVLHNLTEVEKLLLPRWMPIVDKEDHSLSVAYRLPEKLKFLSLGGVPDGFITKLEVPDGLEELRIAQTFARTSSINTLLHKVSTKLRVLEINYNMSAFAYNAMDHILTTCSGLEKLRISVDYISHHMFDEANTPENHPLKQLDLDSSGFVGSGYKIHPDDIFICLAEGRLPHVRVVNISKKLEWGQQGLDDLNIVLLERRTDDDLIVGASEFGHTTPGYGPF